MQDEHKERIRINFKQLVHNCKVNPLLRGLVRNGIFTKEDADYFKEQSNINAARELLMTIQGRPATAFECLVRALNDTGQVNLARLLDPVGEYMNGEQQQISQRRGAEPFILPPDQCAEVQRLHTEFPRYDISLTETPVAINVIPSQHFVEQTAVPMYSTRSKNRGLVKIINIYNFANRNPRRGSDCDVDSLCELFTQFGMTVEVSIDLLAAKIKSEIQAFVKDERLKDADIAILVIMSHGGKTDTPQEYFLDTREEKIYTTYVEDQFRNDVCVHMQGKPKIIIFQTCRGEVEDTGVERVVETDGVPVRLMPTTTDLLVVHSTHRGMEERVPAFSDLLVVHSTMPDQKAHRDVLTGAWFIQLLCQVFMHHAHHVHVEDMLKMVHNNLINQRSYKNTMQAAEYLNKSFKVCYFNPGIYEEDGRMHRF